MGNMEATEATEAKEATKLQETSFVDQEKLCFSCLQTHHMLWKWTQDQQWSNSNEKTNKALP